MLYPMLDAGHNLICHPCTTCARDAVRIAARRERRFPTGFALPNRLAGIERKNANDCRKSSSKGYPLKPQFA